MLSRRLVLLLAWEQNHMYLSWMSPKNVLFTKIIIFFTVLLELSRVLTSILISCISAHAPPLHFSKWNIKKERKKLKELKEQKQTVAILNVRLSLRSRRAKRKQRVFSSRSCVQAAAAAAAGPARTALNRFLSPAIKRHGADALASLLMRGGSPVARTQKHPR